MDDLIETVSGAYWIWRYWGPDPLIPLLAAWTASGLAVIALTCGVTGLASQKR